MVNDQSKDTNPALNDAVVVFEGHDVSIFESPDAVVRCLEPIDVREGIYVVFRADGIPARLSVSPSKDSQRGTIDLQFFLSDDTSRADLLQRLETSLVALGVAPSPQGSRIESMILELHSRLGFTR